MRREQKGDKEDKESNKERRREKVKMIGGKKERKSENDRRKEGKFKSKGQRMSEKDSGYIQLQREQEITLKIRATECHIN